MSDGGTDAMAYLDDFCDNTLTFLQQNIVYVIVAKESNGLTEVVVEPRAGTTIDNIAAGVGAGGVVSGGVYKLRSRKPTDARGLPAYFCGYEQNKTIPLTLKNAAMWMFTVTMDGCTFGVGSQSRGNLGSVRVAHANNSSQAAPDISINTGGNILTGRPAQAHIQAMMATSHVGQGGFLIEPDSYMGGDHSMKATTFGYHAPMGIWTFKSLSYRMGGGTWVHGGVNDYP